MALHRYLEFKRLQVKKGQLMKILVLDANPNTKEHSQSKWALDQVLPQLKGSHHVDVWPLYRMDIPMIDEDVFSAWGKAQQGLTLTDEEKRKSELRQKILEDFKGYDHYVVVSPFWNFGIPAQLKALIDAVAINGETFAYTEQGPKGLLKGTFTHIQAAGGVYSGEFIEAEFGNRYVTHLFQFLGLKPLKPLLIEGTNMGLFNREDFLPQVETWMTETLEQLEV
jgi:FMN-dependent NADH-azoreductase